MTKKTTKKATKAPAKAPARAPGKKTIGINMNVKMASELEDRATSMHLSASKYCKIILGEWLASNQKLKLEEQ